MWNIQIVHCDIEVCKATFDQAVSGCGSENKQVCSKFKREVLAWEAKAN